MEDSWFTLLRHWQEDKWRHALTIPFFLGALRNPIGAAFKSESEAREVLASLLDKIRNHLSNGYCLHLYRCPDLHQLVLLKVPSKAITATPIPPISGGQPGLFSSDVISSSSLRPFEDLVDAVWAEISEPILDARFSCRGKQFFPFNDEEILTIRSALGGNK